MPAILREKFTVYEEGEEESREILGVAVERRDPHGFWHVIKPGKEPLFQGVFTTLPALENAIKQVQSKAKKPPVVKEPAV